MKLVDLLKNLSENTRINDFTETWDVDNFMESLNETELSREVYYDSKSDNVYDYDDNGFIKSVAMFHLE